MKTIASTTRDERRDHDVHAAEHEPRRPLALAALGLARELLDLLDRIGPWPPNATPPR